MKLKIYFFLISLLISFAQIANAQKTYVVAVGLTDYLHPEICPPVECCVNDAKAMAHFFHDYNNSDVFLLLNKNATREHILKTLKSQFEKSTEKDEVIFVYCGHGVEACGLTCYETASFNEMVTYNEIQDIMKNVKARRKIILAMACYSGGLTKKRYGGNNNSQHQKLNKTSVMLYTSSRANEPSLARTDMKHSFFIDRILSAFKGHADKNGDKKITARELFNYVDAGVITDTYGQQHPQMWGDFDDSMVVVYVK